jgi:dTDP-4-amino-4,6-dideoxygalactose transaminase
VEDSAHSIGASYKEKPLGSFGHFAAFSFHETKNIISGEGGMLVINDGRFDERAEVIWEKGTNRASFFRNEISKYEWIDIGSSFLPSEITAAFLLGQLEQFEEISSQRSKLWNLYAYLFSQLPPHEWFSLPQIPEYAGQNHHIFYLQCKSLAERNALIKYLYENEILAVSHYLPLHLSPFHKAENDDRPLPQSIRFSETLIRLPLFHELSPEAINEIYLNVVSFYQSHGNENII